LQKMRTDQGKQRQCLSATNVPLGNERASSERKDILAATAVLRSKSNAISLLGHNLLIRIDSPKRWC
jgi:hypothetical protein